MSSSQIETIFVVQQAEDISVGCDGADFQLRASFAREEPDFAANFLLPSFSGKMTERKCT